MNKKIHNLHLGLTGLLSGTLSFIIASIPNDSLGLVMWTPDTIFGILLTILFHKRMEHPIIQSTLLIIFSSLAYFSAFWTTLLLGGRGASVSGIPSEYVYGCILAGGFVGSLILLIGAYFCITRLTLKGLLMLLATGSILGLAFFIPMPISASAYSEGFPNFLPNLIPLFIVWQTGMAIALLFAADPVSQNALTKTQYRALKRRIR